MLSVATAALLAGPALADTAITTNTTKALTTGALPTSAVGTGDAGNISINTGGSLVVSTPGSYTSGTTTLFAGAITVNSNNFVYNVGAITNKDTASSNGILVNMVSNPNLSTATFTNAAGTTITGTGIYMDAASSLSLSGSGTGKFGIRLYNSDTTSGTLYNYNGNITFATGSTASIVGDSSQGVTIDQNAVLNGNLSFGGTFSVEQTTATSLTASSMVGLVMNGHVNGNIVVPAGGSLIVSGEGSEGMLISGTGVTGSVQIGGSLSAIGFNTASLTQSLTGISSSTIFPEGGSALVVGANVTSGIAILGPGVAADTATGKGSVSTQGTSPAILISPGANTIVTTPTGPLTIGVYGDAIDPGFSFYNRGTIAAQPTNINTTAASANNAMAMRVGGYSATLPTNFAGGIFNSGAITAQVSSSGTTAPANSAIAMFLGDFVVVGDGSGKNSGDQAALVNSNVTGGGIISAAITGSRGGVAEAIVIGATNNSTGQNATLSSIINSGTILATVQTSDLTLDGLASGHPVSAIAIQDFSGTLTRIVNTGTISAQATVLNDNLQSAVALDLRGGSLSTPSGNGVLITDQATSAGGGIITGSILFGTGNNQIINISGDSANHPGVVSGNVSYGLGGVGVSGDQLNIGAYGELIGIVTAPDSVTVNVANHGVLILQNTTTALNATDFNVASGAALSLGVSESLTNSGLVQASSSATIASGANLGVAFNSFVPQGTNAFTLVTAPHGSLIVTDLATYNTSVGKSVAVCNGTTTDCGGSRPFLFASASLAEVPNYNGTTKDALILNVVPKAATGTGGLGLTAGSFPVISLAAAGGGTTTLFAQANAALATDDALGSAMVNGIHNSTDAQAAYNSFAPNVTGGTRAIAISITDQATGVVAAHQRALRMYGKDEGGMTLWGDEFVQQIKDPGTGAIDSNTGQKVLSGFKDHGFGFALGIDGGSPKYGWYGGALTFYAGDVGELTRDSHTNQQWLVLTGYSTWRGKGLFFDSKIDVGYGHIDGKRFINLNVSNNGTTTIFTREADNKHAGALLSGGFTTGGIFSYGATTIMPQLSVDGLLLREDGFTETNPNTATIGDAFDLRVQPYYAQSLRAFLGFSVRYDINLWDFYLQPEARAGYRYDFFNNPVKLKAAFADMDPTVAGYQPGTQFTMIGPDPAQGNFVVGGSLAATTDTWTLGLNFDLVKGSNGAFEQVGTINLLGRI